MMAPDFYEEYYSASTAIDEPYGWNSATITIRNNAGPTLAEVQRLMDQIRIAQSERDYVIVPPGFDVHFTQPPRQPMADPEPAPTPKHRRYDFGDE
jgi:hypothetical protein